MCQPDTNELGKRLGIEPEVLAGIQTAAANRQVKRVVLYDARQRDDGFGHGNIDLIVDGGDVVNFSFDVSALGASLPRIDVINLNTANNKQRLSRAQSSDTALCDVYSAQV